MCAFLNKSTDYELLRFHMSMYSALSNAKFNIAKSEEFSLNGSLHPEWKVQLDRDNITTFHHKGSALPFRDLGYQCVIQQHIDHITPTGY